MAFGGGGGIEVCADGTGWALEVEGDCAVVSTCWLATAKANVINAINHIKAMVPCRIAASSDSDVVFSADTAKSALSCRSGARRAAWTAESR